MIKVALKGGAELRRKLMAMEKGLAADFLRPVVYGGAQDLRGAMVGLAPKGKTGKLAGGIDVEIIKSGKGYAYALIGPQEEQYYGLFQEYGLGTGRSVPIQEKTRRRRGNYEQSMKVRRELLERWAGGEDINVGRAYLNRDLGINYGLTRRELRRQWILEKGWNLQGERRPNMAAHPFMRPAVTWRWPYVRQYITDGLLGIIEQLRRAA